MEAIRPYLMIVLACILLAKIGVTINHTHEFSLEGQHAIYLIHRVENRTSAFGDERPLKVDVTHHER